MKERTRIFVDPSFKKKMIYEAKVKNDMTVMEYSRILANSDKDIRSIVTKDEKLEKKDVKRYKFGF